MKQQIQTTLEYLSNLCLENDKYQNFNDRDLFNATFIFSHTLCDVIWTQNQHLPQQKREELVETVGKMIRELIKEATDKDMHLVAKELLK